MLPTRSTVTVQPASVHQVVNRSRISLSASVSASRRRPPALPGPISPERMTVDQKRAASIENRPGRDMARPPRAGAGLTAPRERLSTVLTPGGDPRICEPAAVHYVDPSTGQTYPLSAPRWRADTGHHLHLSPVPSLPRRPR